MFDDDPNSGCEILRQALRARCKSNHFLVEMAAGVGAEAEALHLFMAQDARLAPAVMSKLAGSLDRGGCLVRRGDRPAAARQMWMMNTPESVTFVAIVAILVALLV